MNWTRKWFYILFRSQILLVCHFQRNWFLLYETSAISSQRRINEKKSVDGAIGCVFNEIFTSETSTKSTQTKERRKKRTHSSATTKPHDFLRCACVSKTINDWRCMGTRFFFRRRRLSIRIWFGVFTWMRGYLLILFDIRQFALVGILYVDLCNQCRSTFISSKFGQSNCWFPRAFFYTLFPFLSKKSHKIVVCVSICYTLWQEQMRKKSTPDSHRKCLLTANNIWNRIWGGRGDNMKFL